MDSRGVIHMTTKVQKWGNSLAIRIPKDIADQLAIHQGSELEFIVGSHGITLKPKKQKPTLDDLLAKVTPENRHAEIDFGKEGNELI